ncbi:UPF0756 membrane protein [Alicyclobacillus contaminans]|uniref:DUF441 domain-containing protein n=1 Tax=Alicyclobacillus contaminans TaxID=392016 RepID=UPI0004160ABA|nr:DUF441 domain-containing protein [Alicyclobacillus contaminans]GMA52504.1 UPF0756 membrane protein [Alicyclobacillus contaminans]
MFTPDLLLILFIIVGAVGRVSIVSVAASMLLVIRMLNFGRFLPMLERRSLELGLLFLMISILVPLASGRIDARDMMRSIFSPVGLITILAGTVATVLNARGLHLLQMHPSLLICVVIGSVAGIVLFGGMPVGPLMATAIAAMILSVYEKLHP